jgi:hypothetical protein
MLGKREIAVFLDAINIFSAMENRSTPLLNRHPESIAIAAGISTTGTSGDLSQTKVHVHDLFVSPRLDDLSFPIV